MRTDRGKWSGGGRDGQRALVGERGEPACFQYVPMWHCFVSLKVTAQQTEGHSPGTSHNIYIYTPSKWVVTEHTHLQMERHSLPFLY